MQYLKTGGFGTLCFVCRFLHAALRAPLHAERQCRSVESRKRTPSCARPSGKRWGKGWRKRPLWALLVLPCGPGRRCANGGLAVGRPVAQKRTDCDILDTLPASAFFIVPDQRLAPVLLLAQKAAETLPKAFQLSQSVRFCAAERRFVVESGGRVLRGALGGVLRGPVC